MDQLNRRDFIALIGGAVAPWPAAARAQQPGRVYRLGVLLQSPADAPQQIALIAELQKHGFVAGQNLAVEQRGYALRPDQFGELASEQVNAKVDVILSGGEAAARAAQQATTTIPIVFLVDDAIRAGLVRSLAQRGGNTTGVSILASELDGKRQEILLEAVPGIRHLAALADPSSTTISQLQGLQDAARARGVALSILQITRPEEIAAAVETAKESGAAALNVLASPLLFNHRQIVFQRVAALRLPGIYQWPEMAEQGGLLGYGPRIVHIFQDLLSRQLVKILRGAKPADIPVEQPTRFELVINLKAAQGIGHEIPAGLVLRADKVIE
jgi:putative ABC transport system substrate-binding protein